MVSTRSIKFKFSEGEKVLCYEPDKAKTKVLYNSKVLEISVRRDSHGKKVAHFLIHFQGWNSTWDRFVTEEFILKDTEDNRKLQRELAEKAQLTAGCGNLYRKDRKKRSVLVSPPIKSRLSPPARETSTVEQPISTSVPSPASSSGAKAGVKRRHSLTDEGNHMSAHNGGDDHSDNDSGSIPRPPSVRSSQFSVSLVLRNWLDKDYDRIKFHYKLLKLPAEPAAVDVLQKWMNDYSLSQIRLMCHKRGHLRPQAGKKGAIVTVDSITRSSNLCREVADSLRVLLEFGLPKMFLYEEEKAQLTNMIRPRETNAASRNASPIELDDDNTSRVEDRQTENDLEDDGDNGEARRKTLRSHSGTLCNSYEVDTKPDVAALLTTDCLNDGGEILALRPMTAKEHESLLKILSRKLVQDVYKTQKHPSTVYGAVHLARVLVKMPDVLANAEYGEPKLSLLVEYLNNFMKYLEEHPQWFSEQNYIDKPMAN